MCKIEDVVDSYVKEKIPPKAPPKAPPMPPCPPTTANPKKVMTKSKANEMSSNKHQCSMNTATRDLYDRLFDEAYRADVVVHTDIGGQIYAHASILVSSFETHLSLCILYEIRCFSRSIFQLANFDVI